MSELISGLPDIHCVPENVITLSRYNSDTHESILIFFGIDVTELW